MLKKYKRDIFISLVPALIVSILEVLGERSANFGGYINFHDKYLYLAIILLWIICILFFVFAGHFVPQITNWLYEHDVKWIDKIDKHIFLIFFLALIIAWIPAVLATWPGVYTYDAIARVRDFFVDGEITAHFPTMHTVFFIGCIELGNMLFNDYNLGVFLYCIVQAILMALCFAFSLRWMFQRGFSRGVIIFGLLFFAVNPTIQVLVLTTTHDILFGGVLLVLMCLLLDAAIYTEEFFELRKNIILFSCTAFVMCMLRNQGVYMLIVLFPFAVLAWKRYRLKMLISIATPIALVFIVTGPIYSLIGVEKANIREALSVPMQQLGRVNAIVEDGISEEEYEQIYRYIPEEYLNRYIPAISDHIKLGFETEAFLEDPLGFVQVWLEVGIHNLGTYIDAFVYSTYGYYYIGNSTYYEEYIMYDGAFLAPDPLNITRQTRFALYDRVLRDYSKYASYEKLPVVRVLFRQALPFILMMICIYLMWLRKKSKELVTIILPFGYFGTLLLGPVAGIRYAFPIVIMIPLFVGVMFYNVLLPKKI